MTTLLANTDLVAVAWLGGVSGLSSGMVSTQLPKDTSTWSTNGFVTATTLSGNPNPYTRLRGPMVRVDCWAVSPGSNKAPWAQANALAEYVVAACNLATYTIVTLPAGYPSARVLQAWVATEPQRVWGDVADTARYTMNVAFRWSQ